MIETLHEIFPNQIIFLAFWGVTVAGLLGILYMVINGENTTKLIRLASDYFADRRASAKMDYDTLFKQIVKLQNELDEERKLREEIQDQLDESIRDREALHKEVKQLTKQLQEYAG